MNYKYKTSDSTFVLSEEEHNKILESMKNGNTMIVLREGNLLLNTKYLKSVNPTHDLTDDQEAQSRKNPQLEAPQEKPDPEKQARIQKLIADYKAQRPHMFPKA